MTPDSDRRAGELGTGALIAMMALFIVVGGPLVYYLWTVVNEILTAQFNAVRALVALPVLLIFLGLLAILSRSVRRWEERLNH